jgi:hypothetical protein
MDSIIDLNEAIRAISALKVEDIPRLKDTMDPLECPVCHNQIVSIDYETSVSAGIEAFEKIRLFTLAQLIALVKLQSRSGLSFEQILAQTVNYGEYLGVHDFHGMFVGIEADGYTHT